MRRVLSGLALWLAASCAHAQTAPSPADVGIVKGSTDTFKLKDSNNNWVPFGTSNGGAFTSVGGGGAINTPPAGSTPVNGACPAGQFLYNNSGNVGCASVAGGGASGPMTLYPTHALLTAGVTTPSGSADTVVQQGFYASGDGGGATYNWNPASYCPGGTSGAVNPADQIVCILPTGQSPNTAGRYILQNTGSIDVRLVGMKEGGFDNAPLVQTLMNASSYFGGLSGAAEIVFPPTPPKTTTTYYFSQPLVSSRNSRLTCKRAGLTAGWSVVLAFPPGIDGIIQEQAPLADDFGYGESEINGCTIMSMGWGNGVTGYTSYPTAKLVSGGSGYTGSSTGTLTFAGTTGGCSVQPIYNVTMSGGAITGVTGTANAGGHCIYADADGSVFVAGGGITGGSGATLTMNPHTVPDPGGVGSYGLQGQLGPNDPTFVMPSSCNPVNHACTMSPGDGIVIWPGWIPQLGQPLVDPGAYVSAVDNVAHTFTLAPPFSFLPNRFTEGHTDYQEWVLPAAQAYTYQSTIGSDIITVTAGPPGLSGGMRVLKPADVLWADGFLLGTSVANMMSNSIVGTPTVHSGGSGFVGASGTMTWNGVGCGFFGTAPVLNVTASGGVITGVTGVANAGNCMSSTPFTQTTWTPGGGLSGGSGASFNMTFNQIFDVHCITEQCPNASNAVKTHTAGSPGKLWTIPIGIHRRAGSSTQNDDIAYFGFGLKLSCGGFTHPQIGCDDASDQHDTYEYAIVGRLTLGDNTSGSVAINNVGANSAFADVVEAGSIGSVYIGETDVSEDNGSALYGILFLCGTQNFGSFISSYLSGQDRDVPGTLPAGYMRGCLGNDAQGNPNIGVGAGDGQMSGLNISPLYGTPMPAISAGGLYGTWGFSGGAAASLTTTAATAAGTNIINVPVTNPTIVAGMHIRDFTTPAAIPDNTVITQVGTSALQISNNITGTGVQAGDQLAIDGYGQNPFMNFALGMESGIGGITMGAGGPEWFRFTMNGLLNSWGFGTYGFDLLRLGTNSYAGYAYQGGSNIIFPNGFELGHGYATGSERHISSNTSPPTDDVTTELPGNIVFNDAPTPTAAFAWIDTASSLHLTSSAIVKGTTTSFSADGCPDPSTTVGTAIIDMTGKTGAANGINVQQPVGNYASCTGTGPYTITLQAPALNDVPSGHYVSLTQWRAVGTIPDPVPPTFASCGTGPSISVGSNNLTGHITTGTGAPTSCRVYFAHWYPGSIPNACSFSPGSANAVTAAAYIDNMDGTGFTLNFGTGVSSAQFSYVCEAN